VDVRAAPDDDPLLTITRADVTGRDQQVDAHVVLRPPGGEPVETDVRLEPGNDLMDPARYDGSAADAFAQVGDALGATDGSGEPLQSLTIVFGDAQASSQAATSIGTEIVSELSAIGFSTSGSRGRVAVTVRRDPDGDYEADSPERLQDDTGGSGDASRSERSLALFAWLVTRLSSVSASGAGGSGAVSPTAGRGGGGGGGFFGHIVAVVTTGACRAFAGENCEREKEQVARFIVALLHGASIEAAPDGRLRLQVSCPTGFGDVSGSIEIKTAPRLGERQVTLAEVSSFSCDEPRKPLTLTLTPQARSRLAQEDDIAVEITVLARGGGHFDGDVVDLTLELRNS
jgi:hypothetical protein